MAYSNSTSSSAPLTGKIGDDLESQGRINQPPPTAAPTYPTLDNGLADPSATNAVPPHPTTQLFTLLFKGTALFLYLFSGFLTDNFVIVLVTCVLLLSADFWTIKNVSGRLLVGLRWWNEVMDDGTNVWVFETRPTERQVNSSDSFVFWSALYGTPLIWMVFGIGTLTSLKFQWLLIVVVAIILGFTNLIGYWKCSKDAATSRLRNWATQNVASSMASSLLSRVF